MREEGRQIHVAIDDFSFLIPNLKVLLVSDNGIQSAHVHGGQRIHEDGSTMIMERFIHNHLWFVISIGVPLFSIPVVVAAFQIIAVLGRKAALGPAFFPNRNNMKLQRPQAVGIIKEADDIRLFARVSGALQ